MISQEIDEYISKAKEQSYKQVLDLGSKGMNVLMQTALKVNKNHQLIAFFSFISRLTRFCFYTLTQHVNLPASIIPSPSPEPSLLSAKREQVDGVTRDGISGNEESSDAEVRPVKTKPPKTTKQNKAKAATRKTTRKVVKTDYNEFSD